MLDFSFMTTMFDNVELVDEASREREKNAIKSAMF